MKSAETNIEKIIEKYSDMVYRLAFSRTKNVEESEDIYQNVFFKMSQKIDKIQSEEHLKAWLIRVTINESNNIFKSAYYKNRADLDENLNVSSSESVGVLNEIFKLDKKDRTIIYLYYYEGYKIVEICEILKMSESSIKTRLFRARNKLKILIEEGDEE